MEKEAAMKLSAKDRKLLRRLEQNARASTASIAKAIGVSKEVANYRLKRLIDAGFIRRFYPLVDYYALGYSCYSLLVNLTNFDEKVMQRIIRDMRKIRNSHFTILLQSIRDMEITLWVKQPKEFYDFYDAFLDRYSNYIQDKEFSLVTALHFLDHGYIHGSRGEKALGRGRLVEIDETDEKIIELLGKDARMPTVDIAKAAGIAASTVSYRIRRMRKEGVIKGFLPLLDVSLLGYDNYKVRIVLNKASRTRLLVRYLATSPNVTRIARLIGVSDLEVEVDFKSILELENFLRQMRTRTHLIKNVEVIAVAREWAE